jgi:ribosome recycling factor
MLTEDRRRELVRMVKQMAEDGRQSIRGVRRSARQELEALDREGEASADEVKRGLDALDKATHAHEAKVDDALAQKEHELLEV